MFRLTSLVASLFFSTGAFAINLPEVPLDLSPPVLNAVDFAPEASGLKSYGPGLPLPTFLQIALGDVLAKPYVLAPEVAASTSLISVDLTLFEGGDTLSLLKRVLAPLGFIVRDVEGVLFVDSRVESDEPTIPSRIFVYEPSHREPVDLAAYSSLFPNLQFSFGGVPSGGAQNWKDRDISYSSFSPSIPGGSSYLVVRGDTPSLNEFKSFLNEVDTAVREVILRTYVLEVRDTENRDSAVNFVLSTLGGGVSTLPGGFQGGASGVRLALPSLSLSIQKLTSDSRVNLLSSPVLRASSGSMASARIGTDIPAVDSILTDGGQSQQSVSYQSAGVLLSIAPRVYGDSVHLEINQELSSFAPTELGFKEAPTKLSRSFASKVVAKPGEVILLGGLTDVIETETKSKGFFSRSKSKVKTYSELVVMIGVEVL